MCIPMKQKRRDQLESSMSLGKKLVAKGAGVGGSSSQFILSADNVRAFPFSSEIEFSKRSLILMSDI